MKIKIKRLLALVVVINVLFACSGCRLAREEQAEELLGDKLVGCYITTTALPEGKIYGTLIEVEEDSVTHNEYVFADYDGFEKNNGIALYATTISATAEHEEYDVYCFGDEVCDRHNTWNIDENNGINSETVSGTIYYTKEQTFYVNSVYQESDGDVYMYKAEMGDLANGQSESTVSVSGTATYTENGKEIAEKTTVTATFIYKPEPSKIKFLFMDENSGLVKEESYEPGKVPADITVSSDIDYILVESYSYDSIEEKDTVIREVYDSDDIAINTFVDNGKGICIRIPTEIHWE